MAPNFKDGRKKKKGHVGNLNLYRELKGSQAAIAE